MSEYFKFMNLASLCLRGDQVRCKRYPVMDLEEQRMPSEFKPRAKNKGLQIGHELQVVVEKSKESIRLRIKDVETGQYAVDHS